MDLIQAGQVGSGAPQSLRFQSASCVHKSTLGWLKPQHPEQKADNRREDRPFTKGMAKCYCSQFSDILTRRSHENPPNFRVGKWEVGHRRAWDCLDGKQTQACRLTPQGCDWQACCQPGRAGRCQACHTAQGCYPNVH